MSGLSASLYRKNDNLVEWTWLAGADDGEYINDGTVTLTLYSGYSLNPATGALNPIAGPVNALVFGPATMTYVPGSNGRYQAKIPASLNFDLSLEYTMQVDAVANGHTARRSIPVTVVDRVS